MPKTLPSQDLNSDSQFKLLPGKATSQTGCSYKLFNFFLFVFSFVCLFLKIDKIGTHLFFFLCMCVQKILCMKCPKIFMVHSILDVLIQMLFKLLRMLINMHECLVKLVNINILGSV